MATAKISGTRIVGIVSVVAPNTTDNLSSAQLPESTRDSLVHHTGIRYRKHADQDSTINDYFGFAIKELIKQLKWDLASIDALICVTQTPQLSIPSVACQLHGELAFTQATLAFDINSGCSGFVYGLHAVSSLLASIDKPKKRAIMCCGDLSSTLTHPTDLSVIPIFSDAVSAIAVEVDNSDKEITGYFNLETAGSGQHAIALTPHEDGKKYMTLNGIDVYNYSVSMVPNNILQLLSFADKKVDFPDYYFLHQANKLINDSICKKIAVPFEKAPSTLYDYGNTASASIPLTINTAWKKEQSSNKWVLLSGFGVGFSVASCLLKFDPDICNKPLVYPIKSIKND